MSGGIPSCRTAALGAHSISAGPMSSCSDGAEHGQPSCGRRTAIPARLQPLGLRQASGASLPVSPLSMSSIASFRRVRVHSGCGAAMSERAHNTGATSPRWLFSASVRERKTSVRNRTVAIENALHCLNAVRLTCPPILFLGDQCRDWRGCRQVRASRCTSRVVIGVRCASMVAALC